MRRRRPDTDSEASLSFLDIIACAFGAIVLLVLVLPIGETGETEPGIELSDYGALLLQLAESRKQAAALESQLAADQERVATIEDMLSEHKDSSNALRDLLAQTREATQAVQDRIAAAEQAQAAVAAAAAQRRASAAKPSDYAGIPVDSEYVAIVVDTSGSMRRIWGQVVREVESVLAIYPEIRGFQILSASGDYLWNRGAWIADGPGNRGVAKAKLRSWHSNSVSSPEPGILTAVRDLYSPARKMAIFVFGDDYQGTDFDNFLATVRAGVGGHASLGSELRIHAFGFESGQAQNRNEYATLMRELTGRHGGAFLALSR